jgi:hypothetical protein
MIYNSILNQFEIKLIISVATAHPDPGPGTGRDPVAPDAVLASANARVPASDPERVKAYILVSTTANALTGEASRPCNFNGVA